LLIPPSYYTTCGLPEPAAFGTGIPGCTFTSRPAQIIDVEKAEINLENTRNQVALDLTRAYLNALAAGKVSQSLKAGLEQARENHRLASLRYEVGVGTGLEVLQASEQWLAHRVPVRRSPVQLPPGAADLRDRQSGAGVRPLGRDLAWQRLLGLRDERSPLKPRRTLSGAWCQEARGARSGDGCRQRKLRKRQRSGAAHPARPDLSLFGGGAPRTGGTDPVLLAGKH